MQKLLDFKTFESKNNVRIIKLNPNICKGGEINNYTALAHLSIRTFLLSATLRGKLFFP